MPKDHNQNHDKNSRSDATSYTALNIGDIIDRLDIALAPNKEHSPGRLVFDVVGHEGQSEWGWAIANVILSYVTRNYPSLKKVEIAFIAKG